MGHVDRAVTGARRVCGLLGVVSDALRALGDLARGGQKLADRGADFRHRRGLFLCAGRLLVGGRLQLGRGAATCPTAVPIWSDSERDINQPTAETVTAPSRPPHRMTGMVISALARASSDASLQQDLLFLVGFGYNAADLVHVGLAGIGQHDLKCRIEALIPAQLHCFFEFR